MKWLDQGLTWVIGVIFAAIVSIGFLQTVLRYAANASMFWGEELMRYLAIWMTLLATGVATSRGIHTRVELLSDSLPAPARTALSWVIDVFILLFGGVLVAQGGKLAITGMHTLSPALGVPIGMAYLALPIAGALMVVGAIRTMVARRKAVKAT